MNYKQIIIIQAAMTLLIGLFVIGLACASPDYGYPTVNGVNLNIIAQIESNNTPDAIYKRDDSIGVFQITPILLKEWNNFNPRNQYTRKDLFDQSVNLKIASWYIGTRIPQMLKHYGKPNTLKNNIIAYNAGIMYVVNNKPLPPVTKQYLIKYERLNK